MTRVIAIDPGQSGAIVYRSKSSVLIIKMTSTESDIGSWMRSFHLENCYGFIERVHSMPKQGVSSSFKFGQSYGFLRGLMIALRIPFEEVTPQKWQKAMGCLSKGDKNVTKARAQQLFPDMKITHATADALLIAEYGRRVLAQRNGVETPQQN